MKTPAIKELESLITFYQDQRDNSARSAHHWRAAAGGLDAVREFAIDQAERHEKNSARSAVIITRLSGRLAMLQEVTS